MTTIGRRPLEPAPKESTPGKLKQLAVDMDTLESNPEVLSALSGGVDSVFCALGTTRSVAGTADAFRKVDLDYVAAAAKAAKASGVSQFSLVSAQGANAGLWSSDFKPFHGLLYSQTKGRAEEAVKAQGFSFVSIMRPGLLERGDLTRGPEKLYGKLMGSVPCSQVAAVMIAEAERFADSGSSDGGVKTWTMKDIQSFKAAE